MPTFDTTAPITVEFDVFSAGITVSGSDRTDAAVEIHPADAGKKDDVRAAEQATVDFSSGTLTVTTPKSWRNYTPLGGKQSIEVTIAVPTGSQVRGSADLCNFSSTGELGRCDLKLSAGDARLEKADVLEVSTAGDVTVDHAVEKAMVTTSNGTVRLGRVDGEAVVDVANGDIAVGHSRGSVTAKTAKGDIRVQDAVTGVLTLETSVGELEVGVHAGSAAHVESTATYGTVSNLLGGAGGEGGTVQVIARNAYGDIIVRPAALN